MIKNGIDIPEVEIDSAGDTINAVKIFSGIQIQNDRLVTMLIEKNNYVSHLEEQNDDLNLQVQ